ncbi:kinase, partial [Thraustotheca clavata]
MSGEPRTMKSDVKRIHDIFYFSQMRNIRTLLLFICLFDITFGSLTTLYGTCPNQTISVPCVIDTNNLITIVNATNGALTINNANIEQIYDYPSTTSSIDCSFNNISLLPIGVFPKVLSLNMSYNDLRSLNDLPAMPQLQSIDLSFNDIEDTTALAAILKYEHLTQLNLQGNRINAIYNLSLPRNLKSLDLSGNPLTVLTLSKSTYNRMLNFTNLVLVPMTPNKCNGVIQKLANTFVCVLSSVDSTKVLHNLYVPIIVSVLAVNIIIFGYIIFYKKVWIDRTVNNDDLRATCISSHASFLESEPVQIRLSISSIVSDKATNAKLTTNCTQLDASVCLMYPNGSIANVNDVKNGYLNVESSGIISIQALPPLIAVDAFDNDIQSIIPMNNSTIEKFNLSHNAMQSIDALSTILNLQTLDVSFNNLSEFPSVQLNQSFSELTYLNLSHNQISSIQLLSFPPQLTTLDISHNPISTFAMTNQVFNKLSTLPLLVLSDIPQSQCNGTTQFLNKVQVCVLNAPPPSTSTAFIQTTSGILTLLGCVIAFGLIVFLLVKRRYCRRAHSSVMMYRDTRLSSNYSCVEDNNPVEYRISLSINMDTTRFLRILETEVPHFKIPMKNLKKLKLVSTPRKYTSYVASYLNDRVDCKVLTPCPSSEETLNNIAGLVNEITMLSNLNHPNIVILVGFATSPSLLDLVMVTELMTYGTVLTVFRDSELNKYLNWKSGNAIVASKAQMALDVATAVAYLHSLETPIVHNAISIEHAWISSKWQVKLAGFMHSTFVDSPSIDSTPEMTQSLKVTIKSDVYLLGRFIQDLDYSLAGETSDAMPTYIRDLITACMQANPNDRPTSNEIVELLTKETNVQQMRYNVKDASSVPCVVSGTLVNYVALNGSMFSATNMYITNVSTLPLNATIINLSENQITDLNKLLAPQVISLNLASNKITSLNTLTSFQELKTLDISNNLLSSLTADTHLNAFDSLRTLSISSNFIATITNPTFPSSLQYLDLSSNPINIFEVTQATFNQLNALPTLLLPNYKLSTFCSGSTRLLKNKTSVCVIDVAQTTQPTLDINGLSSVTRGSIVSKVLLILGGFCFLGIFYVFLLKRLFDSARSENTRLSTATCTSGYSFMEDLPTEYCIPLSLKVDMSSLGAVLHQPDVAKYRLEHADIKKLKLLSTSTFQVVYLASYKNIKVRLKVAATCNPHDTQAVAATVHEVAMLAQVNHPNIIQLVGFVASPLVLDITVALEYMSFGTLERVLTSPRHDGMLEWLPKDSMAISKIQVAYDVAVALAYVHSLSIIHNAVLTKYILLNNKWEVKLTGFAFARPMNCSLDASNLPHLPERTAPEIIHGENGTIQSDIYLFGLMLEDMGTSKMPEMIFQLMNSCRKLDPTERCSMNDLLEQLGALKLDCKQ